MSTPMNPAIPHNEGLVIKKEKVAPSGKSERTMTRLSNPENFALITWLQQYKQQPGDTVEIMAQKAAAELGNPKINYNHVHQRMSEFGIPMPKNLRPDTSELESRIAKIERFIAKHFPSATLD